MTQARVLHSPLDFFAALSLVISVAVTASALTHSFPHAAWLVAYLFLVGFLAQHLLAHGQSALAPPSGTGRVPLETALWNAGVLAVPLGVFTDARLWVVLGGLALLTALMSFWRAVRPIPFDRARPRWLQAAFVALVAVMATSSVIGIALAWHRPWL